jgi:hypothetical protein
MTKTMPYGMIYVIILILYVPCMAEDKKAIEMHKALGEMNIPFNKSAFIKSVKNGNNLAVKLFLDAGSKTM